MIITLTHTGLSPAWWWWCTSRGAPAAPTWAPSWPACRRWRWGTPGTPSSAPRRPCTGTASSTQPSPGLRWDEIMRSAARDELGFIDLALSDTSSLISTSMEWAKTIKVYLRLSRAASLIPSHSFYKSSPLVHFQCFDYSWWDFKSSGAFPG